MAPAVVVLQTFIEPFYVFWTQGKITFDPLLFALLSLGVLVYAVVQPAMAVVIGNNLTKTQLALAGISAIIAFGFLVLLVPMIGILGAGIALLLAELVAAIGYKIYAKRWLNNNDLLWPRRSFYIAVLSVIIAAGSMGAMLWLPDFKWYILLISMALFVWNFWRYWRELPEVATQSAKNIASRIPGVRRVVGRLS
jgi:O-antigen/teichoic acid export membrane protein